MKEFDPIQKLSSYNDRVAFVIGSKTITYSDLVNWLENNCKSERESVWPKFSDLEIISAIFKGLVHPLELNLAGSKASIIETIGDSSDSNIVLKTSGTTGEPKVVAHNIKKLFYKYRKLKTPLSTVLVFSVEHISGIETVVSVISAGGTIYIPESRGQYDVLDVIQKEQIDFLACSPSYFKLLMLTDKKKALFKLKFVNLGGEKTSDSDLEQMQTAYPNLSFYQAYGTTEGGNLRTSTKANSNWFKPGELDKDYRVANGKLVLKINNNWYPTDDLVEMDAEGFIRVIERESKIILVGGLKVIPAKVENHLLKHPEIVDVKVYTEKHSLLGNLVVANIVFKNEALTRSELFAFCKSDLHESEIPVKINSVEQISISKRLKR